MSNLSRRSFLRTGLAGGATLAVSTVSTAALAAKPAKGLYIRALIRPRQQASATLSLR